jgi:hypothetical protein
VSYALLAVVTARHRDIQKTINQNTSTLQRADAIAEELIFAVSTMLLLLLCFDSCAAAAAIVCLRTSHGMEPL